MRYPEIFGYGGALNTEVDGPSGFGLGMLYNWYTARSGIIAPLDFHVPTAAEWTAMLAVLTATSGWSGKEGGKMKSILGDWITPNPEGTNESGFGAKAGGLRYNNGGFYAARANAFFWEDEFSAIEDKWMRYLAWDSSLLKRIQI